jgi:hypothetical protein
VINTIVAAGATRSFIIIIKPEPYCDAKFVSKWGKIPTFMPCYGASASFAGTVTINVSSDSGTI